MSSVKEKDAVPPAELPVNIFPDIDLSTYHEKRAGRLVLDPMCVCFFFHFLYAVPTAVSTSEAHIEFGVEVASRLKLSPDTKTVLWPQPADDPEDPQNVRLLLSTTPWGSRCVDCRLFFSGLNGASPFSWPLSPSLR